MLSENDRERAAAVAEAVVAHAFTLEDGQAVTDAEVEVVEREGQPAIVVTFFIERAPARSSIH
jgi:hypothetical protein